MTNTTRTESIQRLAERLAQNLLLGELLARLETELGRWELLAHWTQGEFHHDLVLRITREIPGGQGILVVATNCNGGVKEVLCFDQVPDRSALWHARCPGVADFTGDLPRLLAQARTVHWFDPCELLGEDARSELKPECRVRQAGGGWQPRD